MADHAPATEDQDPAAIPFACGETPRQRAIAIPLTVMVSLAPPRMDERAGRSKGICRSAAICHSLWATARPLYCRAPSLRPSQFLQL